MKRILTKILSFGALTAACISATQFPTTANFAAKASEPSAAVADRLVYPNSYEEYLPLTKPTDVAVSNDFTAVSEENGIYLYKRSGNRYTHYAHEVYGDDSQNKIAEMQFSEDGDLYFLDGNQSLYKISKNELETGNYEPTTYPSFNCSAFTLFSNTVYYTKVTPNAKSILKATLTDLTNGTAIVDGLSSNPIVTQDGGVLYYTQDEYLYKYTETQTKFEIYDFEHSIQSFCVEGNAVCCVDSTGTFSVYDLSKLLNSERNEEVAPSYADGENDYSAVYRENGYVYAVGERSIKQFSLENNAFTDFEIGASSYSQNRLFNAQDAQLCGNLLVSLDNYDAGGSINLFDQSKNAYRKIDVELKADLLATDGTTALIATTTKAELYDLVSGEKLREFSAFDGDVHGVAAVYGKYYFVTHRGTFYSISKTNGQWSISDPVTKTTAEPMLLTSDIYGNLFVAYDDGSVYRFSETEFVTATGLGTKLSAVIPTSTTKISIDYEGNLYAQVGNEIVRFNAAGDEQSFSSEKSLVYGQSISTELSTFALSWEDNATYFFYDGNFAVVTADLGYKTVKDVPVQNADETIFSESSAEFTVVKTATNALVVHFDIDSLNGAETFPYLSFERTTSERTALKIGETADYYVLAELDQTTKKYSTFITQKSFCTALDQDDYLVTYTDAQRSDGYLTNEVRLYKYPYLNKALKVTTAPKNAKVTLLGEIVGLDYDYYCVSYAVGTQTHIGYVPKAYVTDRDCTPPTATDTEYGAFDEDVDSINRFVFLLLGTAAICILFDFLVIKVRKK